MKKLISLFLALIMIIALGAGSFAATTATYKPSNETLVIGINTEPTSMSPFDTSFTSNNAAPQNCLYDSLITWNSNTYKPEPGIASSWKYLDKYTIEFKIRKDITTDDGLKLTAKDVLYSFRLAKQLGVTATYWTTYDLDKSYCPDDYTFVLVTKVTDAFGLTNLVNIPYSILVEAAVNKNGGIKAEHLSPTAGTGPYKLVKWITGSTLILERKSNYWGKLPYYKTIELRIITDANSRLMSFEAGETSVSYNPSPADIDMVKNNKKFQVGNAPTHSLNMIFMNCTNKYLSDVNVRRALSLATDRESILKVASGGYGTLTDAFWAKLSGGYVKPTVGQPNFFRYNMAEAKKTLAKSAYPKGFTIKFQYIATTPAYVTYSQMLKNAFAQIGVSLELTPVDNATSISNFTKGTYDMGTMQQSNLDPAKLLNPIDSRLGWNVANPCTGYKGGDAFNKLIDGAKFSINDATRKSFYVKLNAWIESQVPEYPLHSVNATILLGKEIKGNQLNIMGSPIFRYMYE